MAQDQDGGGQGWPDTDTATGRLIRSFDWATTALGESEVWPASLAVSVDTILASPVPQAIFWGSDLIQIYNDAYGDILADIHPGALGQSARDIWPRTWHSDLALLEDVASGVAPWREQLAEPMRTGRTDVSRYHIISTPLRNGRDVSGVLVMVTETFGAPLGAAMTEPLPNLLPSANGREGNLLAELPHRFRNTLAIIRSITRRTAETSGTVEEMMIKLDGRLDALTRVQVAISTDPFRGAHLGTLVADEMLAVGFKEGDQLLIEGPDVVLDFRAAERIGLLIHELATNAVQHGAPNARGFHIAISWTLAPAADDDRLILKWNETGSTGSANPPVRWGFGRELFERVLPYEMNAETEAVFGERVCAGP